MRQNIIKVFNHSSRLPVSKGENFMYDYSLNLKLGNLAWKFLICTWKMTPFSHTSYSECLEQGQLSIYYSHSESVFLYTASRGEIKIWFKRGITSRNRRKFGMPLWNDISDKPGKWIVWIIENSYNGICIRHKETSNSQLNTNALKSNNHQEINNITIKHSWLSDARQLRGECFEWCCSKSFSKVTFTDILSAGGGGDRFHLCADSIQRLQP